MLRIVKTLLTVFLIFLSVVGNHDHAYARTSSQLQIHIIDVGQADSIFIRTPKGKTMLIDAGDNKDSKKLIDYLQKEGVEKIDVMLATHPHHDHIGSMDAVMKKFKVGKFYMPGYAHDTKYYRDLMKVIKEKNLDIKEAKAGKRFRLGKGVEFEFLGPNSESYEMVNDYTAVLKLKHGQNNFLFMGDAGVEAEKEILDAYPKLSVDFVKIGHHGAKTSTSNQFLKQISPKYAVISVGKNNEYGYPDKKILQRLKDKKIKIYRTDKHGDIIINSNGREIQILS